MKNEDIKHWAKLYTESLNEDELKESQSEQDILNTVFSTLLYFMNGEGNTVLKDTEWMNYLLNDITNVIHNGTFKPSYEDKKRLKSIQYKFYGSDDDFDDEV